LTAEAANQFHSDGAYIQASHNYQRAATDAYVIAAAVLRGEGQTVPAEWTAAIQRSVRFLAAHQNPLDGSLPNTGANDGSMFAPLSSCAFSDFRPSLRAGGVRYPPGPWDEPAIWLSCADAPLVAPPAESASFESGHHLLRSTENAASFATFRCGSAWERFLQADMLHVDLFWRGHAVAVD